MQRPSRIDTMTDHPYNRRAFLLSSASSAAVPWLGATDAFADDEVLQSVPHSVPQSVKALWADFDPRNDPLETEILREWTEDGGVFRLVRYLIGHFKGKPARMAAIYGFPEGTKEKLPAVMHIHGGGQRAFLHEVKFLVGRGYAAISVNWGGSGTGKAPFNSCEKSEPGDPNTDWGAVDPSQLNVQGYSTMLPGPGQFYEDREHPKNNNWYLLTLGCRRGLTFLEQQPEVDPQKLGVHGYSMGGNLTMYVAGTDDRVRAAVPGVGGQGWRWQPHEYIGGTAQQEHIRGDVEVFRKTMSFESYAPLIRCPVLHRSATNDFHGWMDDVYRTHGLIEDQATRCAWAPHRNHSLTPEVAVTMPMWFDHYLKGRPALPETPASVLDLAPEPVLRVTPDIATLPVSRVEIFYSVDPDPRARFWRSADVVCEGSDYIGTLGLHTHDLPLFAFANVVYRLSGPESMAVIPGYGEPVSEVCISGQLHTQSVVEVQRANPKLTLSPTRLIDDFGRGMRDWYVLNAGNATHQQVWTRKVTDPLWRGPEGSKLQITLKMAQRNSISVVLHQNEWRGYRGPRRTYVCTREVGGEQGDQTYTLGLEDFESADGPLTSWGEIDQLGLCAYFPSPNKRSPSNTTEQIPLWRGEAPKYLRLNWIEGP